MMVVERSPDLLEIAVFNCSYYMQTRKTSKPPGCHLHQWIIIIATILVEGHLRNNCAKLFKNQAYMFGQTDF